ncbi:hypothetical protein NOVOSPHI9U_100002 [Novosphingobium sp. 9U]|nr:hypothetical protein NOVOSPHI9U_100002 [Novosphingobium sp. 9U]
MEITYRPRKSIKFCYEKLISTPRESDAALEFWTIIGRTTRDPLLEEVIFLHSGCE